MRDDIRPKGCVEVPCSGPFCNERAPEEMRGGWRFWVDALDPRLATGTFECTCCTNARSLELTGRRLEWARHERGGFELVDVTRSSDA